MQFLRVSGIYTLRAVEQLKTQKVTKKKSIVERIKFCKKIQMELNALDIYIYIYIYIYLLNSHYKIMKQIN